ncbi:sensor histidine kinase [Streptomyces sp. NBC_01800]|uniref:sensor histidine kinase n=1 Tax=Streptomyces sp. NBC_01800 TaxID=2975945 RepID=UPI002DDB3994|nr:HAMP domain-containing sensor histidine kinase [Streptomyces sp. NBC_01800]WSA65608.1 HAMP domain-containing histidine kinase [Streptomyces sp. NBC_01800]WSA73509.1 HAMP domain-containing histidine kinase [Streptomyces sp. NBC_01800]
MPRRSRKDRRGRPWDPQRLPLRKSLLGRLLAVSVLVAACSVAATAWLAVQTTSGAIKQEQGQNLTADARIYNELLGFAAGHPRWDDVGATVRDLARQSDRRIALTTQNREVIVDSAAGSSPPALPTQASAIVDPLSVDTALAAQTAGTSDTAADRVDPRAVGPFRLPTAERTQLRRAADEVVSCLNDVGIASDVVEGPSGRPRIQIVGNDPDRILGTRCSTDALDEPTRTEKKALGTLNKLANACLDRQGRTVVHLRLDLSWDQGSKPEPSAAPIRRSSAPTPVPAVRSSDADRAIASCVGTARHEQLSSYVASPALLFIGDANGATVPGFDLSPANTARIAGVAALVLALTVGASVLAGARLVRPLRALTGAAQRMRDGEESAAVLVADDNEIGRLAAAFNDMTAHRARLEEQRKMMVSDVAHELRTPLSNIRGWLEAAQDGLADPDPAFISSLLEEAVQLQHIIDDLQDLAAADAGALRLHPEPVRILDLLGQITAAHRARAETAGVTLTVRKPPPGSPSPELTADPVRLRQAIDNLVSNAVRHTPSGGRVTLCAYGTESGDEVVVDVADTGTGISAEDLPYVFDRFWRAEKSRTRRTGGSGLGLAIVRKLAEAHGGGASAVSTQGEGSVFTLRLPAGRAASEPVQVPGRRPEGADRRGSSTGHPG